MVRRANHGKRLDIGAAAEADVGEVDLLADPTAKTQLCNGFID